jgi:hypothetical protein
MKATPNCPSSPTIRMTVPMPPSRNGRRARLRLALAAEAVVVTAVDAQDGLLLHPGPTVRARFLAPLRASGPFSLVLLRGRHLYVGGVEGDAVRLVIGHRHGSVATRTAGAFARVLVADAQTLAAGRTVQSDAHGEFLRAWAAASIVLRRARSHTSPTRKF